MEITVTFGLFNNAMAFQYCSFNLVSCRKSWSLVSSFFPPFVSRHPSPRFYDPLHSIGTICHVHFDAWSPHLLRSSVKFRAKCGLLPTKQRLCKARRWQHSSALVSVKSFFFCHDLENERRRTVESISSRPKIKPTKVCGLGVIRRYPLSNRCL